MTKTNVFLHYIVIADNSSPMTPPMAGSFSPVNNNMCDQNQVAPNQMEGLSQELPLSPMQPTQQQAQAPQTASQQSAQHQSTQSQLTDMPNIIESIAVTLQQNIIDPYRRTGKLRKKILL